MSENAPRSEIEPRFPGLVSEYPQSLRKDSREAFTMEQLT